MRHNYSIYLFAHLCGFDLEKDCFEETIKFSGGCLVSHLAISPRAIGSEIN